MGMLDLFSDAEGFFLLSGEQQSAVERVEI